MPAHHPDSTLLADYAAGSCGEEAAVVIASHASLCSACARVCDDFERVGGALLDDLPPAAMASGALDRALAALDGPSPVAAQETVAADAVFPKPLRRYLGFAAHDAPWEQVGRGLSVVKVGDTRASSQLRLMRIQAGVAMPAHRHEGRELTLVLSGAFSDENGHYVRGDIAEVAAGAEHAPQADADADCVCLALNDGDIRLSGMLGRLLNPFVRF